VHIHWPEKIWNREHATTVSVFRNVPGYFWWRRVTRVPRALLGLYEFRRLLAFAKKSGIRIMWTVHELEPHSAWGCISRFGYQMLASFSDMIIFHSESSRGEFCKQYGKVNAVVMRHGNFDEVYPGPRTRDMVLDELGLDASLPAVCFLGALRQYKGIDLIFDVASLLEEKVQFIVAGVPLAGFPVEAVKKRIQRSTNICFVARHLSEQEFADFAGCCEAFILPYTKITTSGVLHAAFTFRRGVIASDLPYFRETLEKCCLCGKLASKIDARLFADAILEYLDIPAEQRIAAVKRFSDDSSWDGVIKPVADILVEWKVQKT
jgi:glycosyltransferase involved in cell wall biosynthesis